MSVRDRESGFTLVELMVVVAVVGLAGAAVVMNIPGDDERAREAAERFGSRLIAARDHALFSGRETAVLVSPEGYRFEERLQGRWQPLRDRPLAPAEWEGGVRVGLASGEAQRIRFDAVGLSDGADIALTGGAATYVIRIGNAGNVAIDAPN